MQTRLHAVVIAVLMVSVCQWPTAAAAQQVRPSLDDPRPPRFEVAGHFTLLNVDKSSVSAWSDWYHAPAIGATAGLFLSDHLKIDASVQTAARRSLHVDVFVPRQGFSYSAENQYRTASASGGVSWQFLNNRWVHPYAGVGIEAVHETARLGIPYVYSPAPPGAPPERTERAWTLRPYVDLGAKWYFNDRWFIRTDVRTRAGGDDTSIGWRNGIGVDF